MTKDEIWQVTWGSTEDQANPTINYILAEDFMDAANQAYKLTTFGAANVAGELLEHHIAPDGGAYDIWELKYLGLVYS